MKLHDIHRRACWAEGCAAASTTVLRLPGGSTEVSSCAGHWRSLADRWRTWSDPARAREAFGARQTYREGAWAWSGAEVSLLVAAFVESLAPPAVDQ